MNTICKTLRNTLCTSALMLAAMALITMPPAVAQEVVKVGSTLDLAPFEFVDPNGNPQGFEIDILAAVSEKLGVKLEFVKTPFSQAFTGLAAGKYRFNASAIFILCERLNNQHGEFAVPNYTENQAVSTRVGDADKITSLDDLKGMRVGVESKGSTSDGLADAHKDKVGFASKEIYPDTSALFLALEQNRIDAAIQSRLVSQYAIRNKPSMKVALNIPGTTRPSGFIFGVGDPLRPQVDEVLNEMKTSGELAAIYKKWFGVDPDSDGPITNVVPRITPETCSPAKMKF
jgi:ABC-type amino acid transport substrate-binding protein